MTGARLLRRLGMAAVLVLAGCASAAPASPTAAPPPPTATTTVAPKPAATTAAQPTSAPAAAKPPTKIVIGYDGISMTSAPSVFIKEQGYFAKYGLDVDLQLVEGGTKLTAAIVGGSVPLAQNAYSSALSAALQGADLVLIGGLSNKLPFQLVVKKELASPGALRGSGAKLAISSRGSSTDVALRAILKALGLETPKDITIVTVGGENERVAAIKAGQIDGMMAQYPVTGVLEREGYTVVGNAADVTDIPNNATVTSHKFLKENHDLVKQYMKALIEGLHAYKTQPEKAMASTKGFMKLPDDELSIAYDYYTKNVYPDVPRPTMSGIQALFRDELSQSIEAAKTAKAEDFVDTSVIDELDKEGFIKQVLGS